MKKNKKGFTLTDVVLIVIAATIIVTSGIFFYMSLQRRHADITSRCAAANLACAQAEDLLALEYDNPLLDDIDEHPTTLNDIPANYNVTYEIRRHTFNPAGVSVTFKAINVHVTDTNPQGITLELNAMKVQE